MHRLTTSLAAKLTACLAGGMVLLFGLRGYLNLRFIAGTWNRLPGLGAATARGGFFCVGYIRRCFCLRFLAG